MKRGVSIPVLLCVLFFLSGCGFHLKGYHHASGLGTTFYFAEDHSTALTRMLFSRLHTATAAPAQARYTLMLDREQFQTNLASVSAGTNTRQYLYEYSVQFHLVDNTTKRHLPARTLRVLRQVTIDNTRILGSQDEARIIQEEMQQDASEQILSQLSHFRV